MSNDTTASSGVLFNTLGAPHGQHAGPPNCDRRRTGPASVLESRPRRIQAAGLVTMQNTANLTLVASGDHHAARPDHYARADRDQRHVPEDLLSAARRTTCSGRTARSTSGSAARHRARRTSRTSSRWYRVRTTTLATGSVRTWRLPAAAAGSYWDIGVRGDTGPATMRRRYTLAPTYSVLTDARPDYTGRQTTSASTRR